MTLTPALKQYYALKDQYPDALLFFRMGDFYELFDIDAKIAHKVLGISLTSRNKNDENPIPLAGIPFHAKEKYLPQLLDAGYKVAIAEQISDPKSKGLVEREVQRVITPGTAALEGESYENESNTNSIISITLQNQVYGFSSLDITSQEWITSEFHDVSDILSVIYKTFASEIILTKSLEGDTNLQDILSKKFQSNLFYTHGTQNPKKYLMSALGVSNLQPFGIDALPECIAASANLHQYFTSHQNADMSFVKGLKYQDFSDRMQLDEATIQSLDLVYNLAMRSAGEGTLFGALNATKTTGGKRLLRYEILHPLLKKHDIETRQKIIAELKNDTILLEKIRNELKYVVDIEMLLTRLCMDRVGPRDLQNLKKSLISIENIITLIRESNNSQLISLFS